MTVRRIVPDLHVADVGVSRHFYEELFELKSPMDLGWISTLVSDEAPAAQLTVLSRDATAPEDPDVTIEVSDVDAAHERAIALGVDIVLPLRNEPWGVRRFFVRDPDGHVVNVMSHVR